MGEEEFHERRAPSVETVWFAVGQLQESVTRGLTHLEIAVRDSSTSLGAELVALRAEVGKIAQQQQYDAARLKELERWRAEQERIDRYRLQSLESNTANTMMWTVAKWAGGALVAGGGLVVAIINLVN